MSASYRIRPVTGYWRWFAVILVLVAGLWGGWYLLGRSALLIYTDPPGAYIILNDKVQGRSPLALTGLAAGTHRLSLIHSGHEMHVQRVQLEAGAAHRLDIELKAGYGCVYLETLPQGAQVYAGEAYLGVTPLSVCERRAGRETWVISKEGYASEEVDVSIWANTTCRLRVVLSQQAWGRFEFLADEIGRVREDLRLADGSAVPSHLAAGLWEFVVEVEDDQTLHRVIPIEVYREAAGLGSDLSRWELGEGWMLRSFSIRPGSQLVGWDGLNALLIVDGDNSYRLPLTRLEREDVDDDLLGVWDSHVDPVYMTSAGLSGPFGTVEGTDWRWGGWRSHRGLIYTGDELWSIHPTTGRMQVIRVGDRHLLGAASGAAAAWDSDGLWLLDEGWQWQKVHPERDWNWVGAAATGGLVWRQGTLALVDFQGEMTRLAHPAGVVLSAAVQAEALAFIEHVDDQWQLIIGDNWHRSWPAKEAEPMVSWAPTGDLLVFFDGEHRVRLWERW